MAKASRSSEAIRSARLRAISLTNAIGGVISQAIRWAGLCFIVWCVHLIAQDVAGKETVVAFVTKLGANVTFNQWAAYVLGGSGLAYGERQRRIRKRSIARLSARVAELETIIDPKRSGSGLSSQGTTPIDY